MVDWVRSRELTNFFDKMVGVDYCCVRDKGTYATQWYDWLELSYPLWL